MRALTALVLLAACGPAGAPDAGVDAGQDAGFIRCTPETCFDSQLQLEPGCCDQVTGQCLGYRAGLAIQPLPFRDDACPRPTEQNISTRFSCTPCAASEWCAPTVVVRTSPPTFGTWRCVPRRNSRCLLTCADCCDESVGVCGTTDGGVCLR